MIKAGMRYDINRLKFFPDNNGNISPRLSLSYFPREDSKLQLHASYGLFFGIQVIGPSLATQLTGNGIVKIAFLPFPFSILPFALPTHHFPESTTVPKEISFIPQLSQTYQFDKNLRNGYAQQINFGLNYLLSQNTLLSCDYSFVRGVKLLSQRNINPIVRPIPNDFVQSAITGRVDPNRGDVFEFDSSFDSYYHAFTVQLAKPLTKDKKVNLLASYTVSKAIDNFIDITTNVVDDPVDPLIPKNERGLSIQDIRQRFILSGIWEIAASHYPWLNGLLLSTIININSGRPYNLLAGEDLNMNGDNGGGDRPLGLGRNVGILPGFAKVDLRLARIIKLKEKYRLEGIVEILNLFNKVNISDEDNAFPPDAQGNFNLPPRHGRRYILTPDRYRAAFAPRQFQVGFKFSF